MSPAERDARDELADKEAHAREELQAALDTRARLADALTDSCLNDGPDSWHSMRLTTELHVVDLRVDLYRQVIEELGRRIAAPAVLPCAVCGHPWGPHTPSGPCAECIRKRQPSDPNYCTGFRQ